MTEKIYKQIFWLGMAAVIVFSPLGLGAARIWSVTPVLLVSYALIFMWLWRANNRGTGVRRTSIDIPILIFAVLAITSFFFSIYKHDSLYGLVKLFCYAGIYYLIVNEFDREMIKRLLYLVVAVGAALSIYGILQYLNILGHSWWNPKEFIAATFVNHNHFAGYLEMAIPVTVGFIIKKPLKPRLLVLSALIVMVTVFILTQSRGAWISLGLSFLIMIFLFAKKRDSGMKRTLILVLLIAAIISLVYFGRDMISERVESSISVESSGDSFAMRLLIWRGAIDMIRHSPLIGTGTGTFVWGFPRYRPEGLNGLVNFAHNDYLETACDMGIPALIVALWLIGSIIRTGLDKSKDGKDPYRLGCTIGALSLSIHALSDFNFHIPANMLLFTMYSGMIMKLSTSESGVSGHP